MDREASSTAKGAGNGALARTHRDATLDELDPSQCHPSLIGADFRGPDDDDPPVQRLSGPLNIAELLEPKEDGAQGRGPVAERRLELAERDTPRSGSDEKYRHIG